MLQQLAPLSSADVAVATSNSDSAQELDASASFAASLLHPQQRPRSSTASPVPCPPTALPALLAQHEEEAEELEEEEEEEMTVVIDQSGEGRQQLPLKSRMLHASATMRCSSVSPVWCSTASSLFGPLFLILCECYSLSPTRTLSAMAVASYCFGRARRAVGSWIYSHLPWSRSSGNAWSKVVSWRTFFFLSRASRAHTEASQPRHDAALVATAQQQGEEEEEEEQLPEPFCRVTAHHLHLYALSLGVIPTSDADLLHQLRDIIFYKPLPQGWSLLLSDFFSFMAPSAASTGVSAAAASPAVSSSTRFCGIRFVDRRGALRISHPDIEFAIDAIRHEAHRRTRCDPAARRAEMANRWREMASIFSMFSTSSSSSLCPDLMMLSSSSFSASLSTNNNSQVSDIYLAMMAMSDNFSSQQCQGDDDDVFSILQQVNAVSSCSASSSCSPARLPRANRVPPPTEFDLVSPPRKGASNVSSDTSAHVEKLLEHFSAGRALTAAADGGVAGDDQLVVCTSSGGAAFANDSDGVAAFEKALRAQQAVIATGSGNESALPCDSAAGKDPSAAGQANDDEQHDEEEENEGGERAASPAAISSELNNGSCNNTHNSSGSLLLSPGKLVFSSSMRDHVSPAGRVRRKLQEM